jgi:hypothetical protein
MWKALSALIPRRSFKDSGVLLIGGKNQDGLSFTDIVHEFAFIANFMVLQCRGANQYGE